MKITDLANFEIKEDHIQTPQGRFLFYRVIPPNLSILNPSEKQAKINSFEALLSTNEIPLHVIAMDKAEDLTKNKSFWKNRIAERFEEISNAILDIIGEIESTSSGMQRAYYFIIRPTELEQSGIFETLLSEKGFRFQRAERSELITVMRAFLLRDFLDFDIYTFEQEVRELYEAQKGTAK